MGSGEEWLILWHHIMEEVLSALLSREVLKKTSFLHFSNYVQFGAWTVFTVKPEIIQTPGKFWVKATFIQPNWKLDWKWHRLPKDNKTMYKRQNISQFLFRFEQKVACPKLFIPFSVINRNAYYSNQMLPIIASQLFVSPLVLEPWQNTSNMQLQ